MTKIATIGDNSAAMFADLLANIDARVDKFLKGAEVWSAREELDDDLAARANDYLTGLRKLYAEIDGARKAEKQPHIDAGRAIDEKWSKRIVRVEAAAHTVRELLTKFLRAKQQKQREEAARLREAAAREEAARRAAEAEAENAQTVADKIAAKQRAAESEEAAREAAAIAQSLDGPARAESFTGAGNRRGLRRTYKPRLTSLPLALAHYRDEPKLAELLLTLAARDLRAAPTVRGVKQRPTIPGIVWDAEESV